MKKVGEIFELPLIAIDEGIECGKVKELLVNPENGRVEYLIIDDGQWYLGAKVLSFDKIIGIGIDAVTTNTVSDLKRFGEVEEAVKLAEKNVRIIGAKCYTQKGKFMGTAKEYFINEDDGTITGSEIEAQGGYKTMPASSVLTYGKDVLVLVDNVEETLECNFKDEIYEKEPSVSGSEHKLEVESGKASKLFEQRQIQFLLGKKANKRIVDHQGNILVDKGQLVTEEIVEKIKACGKLVELTINISS